MKIGFDFDDVIANSYEIIRDEILKSFDYDIEGNVSEYMIQIPNISCNDRILFINNILVNRSRDLKPNQDALLYLEKFYNIIGHEITIVTARDENQLKEVTDEWLKYYLNVPYNVIYLPGIQKVDYLNKNKFTHFVDDRFLVINECSQFLEKCYLMDCEWNRDRDLPKNASRVFSLSDVYEDFVKCF